MLQLRITNAPYIAVQRPGLLPIVIETDRYEQATKGVEVTAIEIADGDWLVVRFQHATGKGCHRFRTQPQHLVRPRIWKYAESLRKKHGKPVLKGLAKRIATMQAKLAKLMQRGKPRNPALNSTWGYYLDHYAEECWARDRMSRRKASRLAYEYGQGRLNYEQMIETGKSLGLQVSGNHPLVTEAWREIPAWTFELSRKPRRLSSEREWGGDRLREFCAGEERPERDYLRDCIAVLQVKASEASLNETLTNTLPTRTCAKCGAKWLPRTLDPKQCPTCKSLKWKAG